MTLHQFARVDLCHRPTPLERLERLSAHLGGPDIYVKRDDCTGLAFGGNKTRKLEFLLADALVKGCDTVITTGGTQSNHCRQTAAAAARLGMKCELVLPHISRWSGAAYLDGGNVLLDRLLGATLHAIEGREQAPERAMQIVERVRSEGGKPYYIPVGGSSPLGALGYVAAAEELVEQSRASGLSFDYIIITTGSCTTHAGLLVGLERLDRPERVIGMTIYLPRDEAAETVRVKAIETCELLDMPAGMVEDRVEVLDGYLGAGYGEPTDAMLEAVTLAARLEGLLLDPVYTGKTLSGLIDLVRRGFFRPTDRVLFWHTGGTPALFAYHELFANGRATAHAPTP